MAMTIERSAFGTLASGKIVNLWTLKAGDLTLSISELGAAWTALETPDRRGRLSDIILGYGAFDGWTRNKPFFGVTVGRFANRIARAQFSLDGRPYPLYTNDGPHSLHGGRRGFDKQVWTADGGRDALPHAFRDREGVAVRFELESPDGDEGYPGNLRAVVTYGLTYGNEVVADYAARVDQPCPVNFTNHAYFNLGGEGTGPVTGHEAVIHGSHIIEVDQTLVPTGRRLSVNGTPFDFQTRKPVGAAIEAAGGGYDHCYVLDGWDANAYAAADGAGAAGEPKRLFPAAEVYEKTTGRVLKLKTTQPGLQFYTGNFLDGIEGKPGSVYRKHDGFCLETQHFPDSPNQSGFPSALFGPERDYHERAVFSFSTI